MNIKSKEPCNIHELWREATGDTGTKIIAAIAPNKPYFVGVLRNVSGMIEEQLIAEFDMAAKRLREHHPENANLPFLASGVALMRFAHNAED